MISAEDLHRAAERIADADPMMDQLAAAGAQFLRESEIHAYDHRSDALMESVTFDPRALGYGIMLGYLAALDE